MQFNYLQKVLFRHCDPAGIVFYPRYFEMVNDCVEAFFAEIGSPFEDLHGDAALPTARIETVFQAPSRHGDMLQIGLDVLRVGGSSLSLELNAVCDGQARFTATPVIVYVNAQGRPQRWPDNMRTAFSPYLRSNT